jgi:hypothetical protein
MKIRKQLFNGKHLILGKLAITQSQLTVSCLTPSIGFVHSDCSSVELLPVHRAHSLLGIIVVSELKGKDK